MFIINIERTIKVTCKVHVSPTKQIEILNPEPDYRIVKHYYRVGKGNYKL